MKKWISVLLVMIMVVQMLPVNAMAAAGRIITDEELVEALGLAGLELTRPSNVTTRGTTAKATGSAGMATALSQGYEITAREDSGYHPGMEPDEAWDAQMIIDMIEQDTAKDFYHISDTFARAVVVLERMKTEDPAEYARLVTDHERGDELLDMAVNEGQNGGEVHRELLSVKEQLEEDVVMIEQMTASITSAGEQLMDYELVRRSNKIRAAMEDIKYIRTEVIVMYIVMLAWSEEMLQAIDGTYDGSIERLQMAHDWLGEIFAWEEGPEEAVSPVMTSRGGVTRMSRLGAGAGLLGAGNAHDATLTVIRENQICLRVYGENDEKLGGVTVKTQDCSTENAPVITNTTDDQGRVIISADDFNADFEKEIQLHVWVEASSLGYRDLYVPDCSVYRGGICTYYTKKLDSAEETARGSLLASGNGAKPYIYSADFKGYDIIHQNFDMLYSSANDWEFDIKVTVKNPSGKPYSPPVLHYFDTVDDLLERKAESTSEETTADGDVYVFRGKWKQLFLPEGVSKPFFMLGDEKIPTLLTSVRSDADKPTVVGDEPNSPLSNLLAKGAGLTFTIPIGEGLKVDLKLPLGKQYYWPKIVQIPNGFTISIGSDSTNPDQPTNWQNQEAKQYDKALKKYEKETFRARKAGELGEAYKYYKNNKVGVMKKSSLDFGWFVMASVRWDKDDQDPSTLVTVGGATGATAVYSYDWTYPTTVGPIPAYVNFNFSVALGACFQFQVDLLVRGGKLSSIKVYPMRAITIDFRITVAMTLGVGIKGLVSAWVKGTVMLNLILSFYAEEPNRQTAYFQATAAAGVELLFVTFSYVFLKSDKKKILDHSEQETQSSSSLFDLLMGRALAEETPEEVPVARQTPEKYPALTAELTKLIDPATLDRREMAESYDIRTVKSGKYTYAFFIRYEQDLGKYTRLSWICLEDKSKYGTFTNDLAQASQGKSWDLTTYNDSSFDVYSDGRNIYVVCVTYGAYTYNSNGMREPAHVDPNGSNPFTQMVYTAVMGPSPDGSGKLLTWILRADPPIFADENYRDYNTYNSVAYPKIIYARTGTGSVSRKYEIYGGIGRYPYSGNAYPGMTGFEYVVEDSLAHRDTPIHFTCDGYVRSGMDQYTYRRYKLEALTGTIQEKDNGYYEMDLVQLSPGFIGLSSPRDGSAGDSGIEFFDVSMNAQHRYFPEYETDAVCTNTGVRSIVLDKGDIRDFTVVQYPDGGDLNRPYIDVFYAPWESKTITDEETGESYEVGNFRLKSLHIEPRTNINSTNTSFTLPVTKFDYDISIPTPYIKSATFGGMSYLYWTTSLVDPENEDKALCRVDCVAFDPSQNAMSDVTTLAEFEIPDVYDYMSGTGGQPVYHPGSVVDVQLTAEGVAYACIKATPQDGTNEKRPNYHPTLFSFPTDLKPVLDFTGMVLADDTVTQGQFLGVKYILMNEGNVGISSFDMELYKLDKNGNEGSAVEILHADLLDISKSTLTDTATGKVLASGTAALTRAEDYVYGGKLRDWTTSHEKMSYKVDEGDPPKSGTVDDSQTQYIHTEVLVPGALGSLNSTILIPNTWSGDTTLRLKMTHMSVYSNWSGVMAAVARAQGEQQKAALSKGTPRLAARGGDDLMAAVNSVMSGGLDVDSIIAGVEGARRLDYEYDEASDKLVLQKQPTARGEEEDMSMYAREIDSASQDYDVVIEENDIEVGHRLYFNAEGEYMLDISLINYISHEREGMRMTCAVYIDGAEEPYYVSLPYDADQLAHGKTQTITLKPDSIADTKTCRTMRFVFRGIGFEETAYSNNEFTLRFNNGSGMYFVQQPEDAMAAEGQNASFSVEVAGSQGSCSYRWQLFNSGSWWNIGGADGPVLTMENVTMDMDGRRVRCVVTDTNGKEIISDEAVLTVTSPARTGDTGMIYVYAGAALAALVLLALLLRRKKRKA